MPKATPDPTFDKTPGTVGLPPVKMGTDAPVAPPSGISGSYAPENTGRTVFGVDFGDQPSGGKKR